LVILITAGVARGQISIDTDGNVAVGLAQPPSHTKLFSECNPGLNCTGNNIYGLIGKAENNGYSAYGMGGFANSNSSDVNIGVRGFASAASSFIAGIHGRGDGTGSFAGFFLGNVHVTGGINGNSDERFKQEVASLDGSVNLEKIIELQPRRYFAKSDEELQQQGLPRQGASEEVRFGLIAQELEEVIPELVREVTSPVDLDAEGEMRFVTTKAVNYIGLIPVLIAGMQEQQKQIDRLAARIEALENMMLE